MKATVIIPVFVVEANCGMYSDWSVIGVFDATTKAEECKKAGATGCGSPVRRIQEKQGIVMPDGLTHVLNDDGPYSLNVDYHKRAQQKKVTS